MFYELCALMDALEQQRAGSCAISEERLSARCADFTTCRANYIKRHASL